MARSKTTITSQKRKEMPSRGKNKRTLIFEAIKEASLIGLSKDSTNEEVEIAFFGHVAARAFNPDDQASGMCLKALMDRIRPPLKPTGEPVNFKFNSKLSPGEQASQVMQAASQGDIPPDVAQVFIGGIASMLRIDEVTELQRRLEALEEKLGVLNG